MKIYDKKLSNTLTYKYISYLGDNIFIGEFEFSLLPTLIYKKGQTYEMDWEGSNSKIHNTVEVYFTWLFWISSFRFKLKDTYFVSETVLKH